MMARVAGFDAAFGEKTTCSVTNTANGGTVQSLSWSGPVKGDVAPLDGGSSYSFQIKNDSHFALSLPVTAKMRVTVAAVPAPSRESFYVTCDPTRLGKEKRFPLELRITRAGKTLWTGQIDTPNLKQRKSIWVSYRGWGAGPV